MAKKNGRNKDKRLTTKNTSLALNVTLLDQLDYLCEQCDVTRSWMLEMLIRAQLENIVTYIPIAKLSWPGGIAAMKMKIREYEEYKSIAEEQRALEPGAPKKERRGRPLKKRDEAPRGEEAPKKRRGRPPKNKEVNMQEEAPKKRRRGRPPKNKEAIDKLEYQNGDF